MKKIIIALFVIASVFAIDYAYNASMHNYCLKLERQSTEYEHFFISELDYKECSEVYNITINATIK